MPSERSRYADEVTASTPDPGSRTRSVALGVVVFVAALILLFGLLNVARRSEAGAAVASPSVATARPTARRSTPSPAPSGSSTAAASGSPTSSASASGSASASPAASPSPEAVLVGAGDIATCSGEGDSATASIIEGIDGAVFTAGDNAYENGTSDDFRDCYDPTWGRFKDRTRPAPGNHDWQTKELAGYRDYFGTAAGPAGTSWYSYELGAWHVIVLDAECEKVGGCGADSPQGQWLSADLAASSDVCTLAIWHNARFSSGQHGNDDSMAPFWRALYAAGADLVVNGHDHDYERFAPQDPDGRADPARGIREFVVGTGGAELRGFATVRANSELRASVGFGVIRLDLHPTSYDWRFIPTSGDFTDSGIAAPCH